MTVTLSDCSGAEEEKKRGRALIHSPSRALYSAPVETAGKEEGKRRKTKEGGKKQVTIAFPAFSTAPVPRAVRGRERRKKGKSWLAPALRPKGKGEGKEGNTTNAASAFSRNVSARGGRYGKKKKEKPTF